MNKKVTIAGKKPVRGERMPEGGGWLLVSPKQRTFAASLLKTVNRGGMRLAIFSVPKRGGGNGEE